MQSQSYKAEIGQPTDMDDDYFSGGDRLVMTFE